MKRRNENKIMKTISKIIKMNENDEENIMK